MSDVSKKALEKIKEKHITPRSNIFYMIKRTIFWFVFPVTLFLAAVAFGAILFHFEYGSAVEYSYTSVKSFWIYIFIFMLLGVFYEIRSTQKGYKYNTLKLLSLSIVFSFFFGSVLFLTNVSRHIDTFLSFSFLRSENVKNLNIVSQNPDEGVLTGTVFRKNRKIFLEDIHENTWEIDAKKISGKDFELLNNQNFVRIEGEKIDNKTFLLQEVFVLEEDAVLDSIAR